MEDNGTSNAEPSYLSTDPDRSVSVADTIDVMVEREWFAYILLSADRPDITHRGWRSCLIVIAVYYRYHYRFLLFSHLCQVPYLHYGHMEFISDTHEGHPIETTAFDQTWTHSPIKGCRQVSSA
jgi:hypothetical protein